MSSAATPSRSAHRPAGSSQGALWARGRRGGIAGIPAIAARPAITAVSVALGLLGALAVPAPAAARAAAVSPAGGLPTLLVVGLDADPSGTRKEWQERRLGMGIRGRLTQMFAASGAFTLREEKDLAPSVQAAIGGYWLREKSASELRDLDGVLRSTGSDWVAYGTVERFGVTRDRVQGLLSGERWLYRAKVRLCLRGTTSGGGGRELCREGNGQTATEAFSVVISYQGDEVTWDQAGPAQAVDRALIDAFNRLMPEWQKER